MRLPVLLCLLGLSLAERVSYEGYQVYTVTPTDARQLQLLTNFDTENQLDLDWWTEPQGVLPHDVLVSPESSKKFRAYLEDAKIHYNITIEDVKDVIEYEDAENSLLREYAETQAGPDAVPSVLGRYARLSELNAWIDSLVTTYPTLCKTSSIGKSYEGRDIRMLSVSGGSGKLAIFIDASMHAREWITGGTITHLINQLLTTKEGATLLERYDFYFVPVVNADGYEYTHTRDRMWRKSRGQNPGSSCLGTDLNRNFDHGWGGVGSSSSPCSGNYRGPSVFSEPEAKALRDAILALSSRLILYLNLHSYSQMWLTPYGNFEQRPPDAAEIDRVGHIAAKAILDTHNRVYRVGPGVQVLYPMSGTSMDWAKSKGGAKYSSLIELRPRSAGEGGFIIPPSEILPTGQEIWNALVAIGSEMKYP